MHMRRAPSNERLDASRGATRRAVAARTTAPKRGGVLVRLLPDKPTAAAGLGLLAAACLLLLRMPAPAPQLRPYAPGPPTAALSPPGECALDASWRPLPLAARRYVSRDAVLLRFGLDAGESLRLPTCACLLAGGGVVRPYTPVSTNALVGSFELLVKVYAGAGLSARLAELPIGDTVDFSHVPKNVKVQFPFGAAHLAMIAGGSGVTPMLQALHAVLGSPGDETAVTVFVCGPPGMYEALAGPRDDPALAGLLRDLGYAADQVVKF
ncbi:cytochrome-b5 reductase [Aureococcus anophagefferens]|nr:cytochrome-b5 reductase [Aureococcus anophagefferens]